ncbi:hypothetical protein IU487_08645 [Nocardia puris]|uniref:hypothetical protein n=1 Tax=Nocardia puris TaxID=208602 RepID=UPI0018930429|nr:hypothetical protein [Nocardia puris]MBF6211114.1 hypothetical protein [Nocardia puris]
MTSSALAAFRGIEAAYARTSADRPLSVHESFSALDFQVRFLALIAVSSLHSLGLPTVSIGRSPGLGEWVSLLRNLRRSFEQAPSGTLGSDLNSVLDRVLSRYDLGIPDAPPMIRSTKNLRDHVSHGGAIPDGLSEIVEELVRAISDEVALLLSEAEVNLVEVDESRLLRPTLAWPGVSVSLWPFIFARSADVWCVYSNFHGGQPVFLEFGTHDYRRVVVDEGLVDLLRQRLVSKRVPDSVLEVFRADVESDLSAFSDVAYLAPQYFEHDHGFGYEWGKSVSEGVQARRDYFRLGPDGPQWQSEQGWVPYREYLRQLANWPIIASRLRYKLDDIERQFAEEEVKHLGWKSDVKAHREAHVMVTEYGGGNPAKQMFSQLIDGVDEDLGVEKGQTQVVFINGEAGIGKTRAMVKAARNRAYEVENGTGKNGGDSPLFLYVRSTGRVLDNLDAAVNDAVALTQNLTDERVKALCRNGLIALLIDGFDELLGGAAYSDALDSLQGWLDALGGRGVLVVSARSSFYVNQYRSSVQRATKTGNAAVRHRIAEVQRWSSDEVLSFLKDYGLSADLFLRLSGRDRLLLGLPFFARAFAEMCLSGDYETSSQELSFTEQLLNYYIVREERKLAYSEESGTGLLNRKELKRTFEYVAEIMVDSREREVDSGDLELAAAMALGLSDVDELDERTGLRERLQVLCGLTSESGTRGPTRFRFQHEVFFDNFLAGMASNHLSEGQLGSFHRLMARTEWRSATVSSVVASSDLSAIVGALNKFQATDRRHGVVHDAVAATNLGAMWSAVIAAAGYMPGAQIVGAAFVDPLDLSRVNVENVSLVDCRIDSLVLPTGSGWRLELVETKVKKMTVPSSNADLKGLTGVHHKDLVELMFRNGEYNYRRPEILRALRSSGAEVVDAGEQAVAEIPVRLEATRHYLKNLEYAHTTLILKDSYQPEDHRLSWAHEYSNEWKPFIDNLQNADLARVETLAARGARKVRLRLKSGPTNILDEDSEDPRIKKFWALVKTK